MCGIAPAFLLPVCEKVKKGNRELRRFIRVKFQQFLRDQRQRQRESKGTRDNSIITLRKRKWVTDPADLISALDCRASAYGRYGKRLKIRLQLEAISDMLSVISEEKKKT